MPALRDLQKRVQDAVVRGNAAHLESVLVGGSEPTRRLAIHQRHYTATLVTALLERFPATVWLVGSPLAIDAAKALVHTCPPSRPCIAEYGAAFPAFLAARPGATGTPYLRQFAELEWHVARLSLAIDRPALTLQDVSAIDVEHLAHATVTLQPGVHYLRADWAVDELMSLFLTDRAPDRFTLEQGELWLELRGVRGDLWMNRLTDAEFAFRAALAARRSLTDAAVAGLELATPFDPRQALLRLVNDKLVVAITRRGGES